MSEKCNIGFCINLDEGEIRAEAGLCAVIPCSFTPDPHFNTQNLIWHKCEKSKQNCGDSDIILDTNRTEIQSEFKGRVSLLEPNVSQKNCSIIVSVVSDLAESNSGSFQLRIKGTFKGKVDGFSFNPRATVSVKGMKSYSKYLPSTRSLMCLKTAPTCFM